MARSQPKNFTHAGGVVYRRRGSSSEFLLVTSRWDSSVWVLPKGHMESGESPEQTAAREVLEETGVTARIVEFLGTVRQAPYGEPQEIAYYLMEMVGEGSPTEARVTRWLAPERAVQQLTYAGASRLVEKAWGRLVERKETRLSGLR